MILYLKTVIHDTLRYITDTSNEFELHKIHPSYTRYNPDTIRYKKIQSDTIRYNQIRERYKKMQARYTQVTQDTIQMIVSDYIFLYLDCILCNLGVSCLHLLVSFSYLIVSKSWYKDTWWYVSTHLIQPNNRPMCITHVSCMYLLYLVYVVNRIRSGWIAVSSLYLYNFGMYHNVSRDVSQCIQKERYMHDTPWYTRIQSYRKDTLFVQERYLFPRGGEHPMIVGQGPS